MQEEQKQRASPVGPGDGQKRRSEQKKWTEISNYLPVFETHLVASLCVAMRDYATNTTTSSSSPTEKRNRQQIAAHCGLSLRTIDELTRNGTLPFFKIGKSVRYDLYEVEEALRQRFHVSAKARKLSNT